MIACQGFDAGTTLYKLRQGHVREFNPIMRSLATKPVALVSVKLGVGTGLAFGAHTLRQNSHPLATKITSGVVISLGCGAGIWNLAQ